jgi:hypothetical protein
LHEEAQYNGDKYICMLSPCVYTAITNINVCYINVGEILRFPSVWKFLFHCLMSQYQNHHNQKYHWAYENKKQVLFFYVLLSQTSVQSMKYNYSCILNIKNKWLVTKQWW